MKNIGFLLLAIAMLMASCGKEKSLETGGTGGGGTGGGGGSSSGALLIKVVTTGAQSSTQDLTYDSKNRLSKYAVSASGSGINTVSTYTITRDAEGRVTKIVQDIPASGGQPANSATTDFFYLAPGDKKLKHGIYVIAAGAGFAIRDSIAYQYTGNNVTKTSHYYSIDNGGTYDLFNYSTFKYDARGNVIEQILFADLGGGFEETQVVTTEFDSKPNPCNFDDDAFLEQGMSGFLPTNNAIKQTIRVDIASTTITASGTYEYRSDGKPSKSNGNLMGAAYQAVFTYK
jgi:hypothetical protein